jgi:hypothetical protein
MTLAAAGPAQAQDEARVEAAKAFGEGEKAFARKDYALAARRFEEAYPTRTRRGTRPVR